MDLYPGRRGSLSRSSHTGELKIGIIARRLAL